MTEMQEVLVNGRWPIKLVDFRAERPEWTSGWEVERLNSMFENIHPGMVVYDIGTEEGDLSALFATWGAKMVLVEPNPLVWPCVYQTWVANELPDPLLCLEAFVAADTKMDHFDPESSRLWPSSVHSEPIKGHGFLRMHDGHVNVPRITIDDIPRKFDVPPPDVITIDVEGAEYEVARGMLHTLESVRPLVWISVHAEMMVNEYHEQPGKLYNQMRSFGYESRFLHYDHEEHFFFWPRESRVSL